MQQLQLYNHIACGGTRGLYVFCTLFSWYTRLRMFVAHMSMFVCGTQTCVCLCTQPGVYLSVVQRPACIDNIYTKRAMTRMKHAIICWSTVFAVQRFAAFDEISKHQHPITGRFVNIPSPNGSSIFYRRILIKLATLGGTVTLCDNILSAALSCVLHRFRISSSPAYLY